MAANSNETEARILNYIKYLYDRTNKYITGYVNKDELCRIIMLHPSIYSERAIVLVCRVAYCVFLLQCICSKNVFLCFRHRFISPPLSVRSFTFFPYTFHSDLLPFLVLILSLLYTSSLYLFSAFFIRLSFQFFQTSSCFTFSWVIPFYVTCRRVICICVCMYVCMCMTSLKMRR